MRVKATRQQGKRQQATSNSCAGAPIATCRQSAIAFTMVELIVVVAIIALLLAIVIPPVNSMWEQRKISTAENNLRGALSVARRRAITPGQGESGLLFVVDEKGTQRIFHIQQQAVRDAEQYNATVGALIAQDRFVILPDDRESTLPPPMRVVPRSAVEHQDGPNAPYTYDDDELTNNVFPVPATVTYDEGQRHRNFFTMVFSTDGRLLKARNVLIVDEDKDADGTGDRTGFGVGETDKYFTIESISGGEPAPIDPDGGRRLKNLICVGLLPDGSPTGQPIIAINFPSVDGVLLYDDSLFNQQPTRLAQREMLIRTAQPLYVAGPTGNLVRGPIGENVVPPS